MNEQDRKLPEQEATRLQDEDHGFLRDDGQKDRPHPDMSAKERARRLDEDVGEEEDPVLMPDDERFPEQNETFNADKGDRPAETNANRDTLDLQELEDAYSRNDPGIETKE